jgi:hypothetical protein
MKKNLKRIGLVLLVFLVLLMGTSIFITLRYKNLIGNQLLAAVNNSLITEATVKNFDLTFFRSFPNVSASLIGVEVEDTNGNRLCYADALSARISLFPLFNKKVRIKSITLKGARLYVRIDRQGRANFDIFKPSENKKSSYSYQVSLEEAALEDILLFFDNQQNSIQTEAFIQKAKLNGNFSSSQTVLRAQAQLESRFVQRGNDRFLVGVPLAYDGKVEVNSESGMIRLNNLDLQIGPNPFQVDGSILSSEGMVDYDLLLKSEKGSLASVIDILPASIRESLQGIDSRGNFNLEALVKGKTRQNQLPRIQATFSLEDGRITSTHLNDDLRNVRLKATFSNGADRTLRSSVFEIQELEGYFSNRLVEGRMRLSDLEDPYLQIAFDGIVPINSVFPMLGSPNITRGSGEIEFEDVQLEGRISDMVNTSRIYRVRANGTVEFDDAMLEINGNRLVLDRGEMVIQNNEVAVKDLELEGPGTELQFQGSVQNLLPVLFADSSNSKGSKLNFQARLEARELGIDELLAAMDLGIEQDEKEKLSPVKLAEINSRQVAARQRLTNLLNGTFEAHVAPFTYGKVQGKNFKGQLQFSDNQVRVKGSTLAMGGAYQLDGTLFFERLPRLQAKVEGQKIDVGELFRQCQNFGQTVITDKNLNGILDAKILVESQFDEMGGFDLSNLRMMAAIGIEQGRLKNFEPLQELSSVIKEKDLNDIRFSDLQNYLEIRDKRLYIPVMFIQSSAINLTLNGVQGFDDSYLYNIKANVLQALGQKIRRHDRKLDPIKARKKGFVNLYYQVKSQNGEIEVRSARREVVEDFQNSSLRKRDIRVALQNRFGYVQMVDEPMEWRDIPEYRADPEDRSEEFIEWEMEGGQNQ